MREFNSADLRDRELEADGCEFIECALDGATLVYRGGEPFVTINCTGQFSIRFEDAAENTLNTLRAMHLYSSPELVERIIESLRNPHGDAIN